MGRQRLGQPDSGGAVSAADNADGSGLRAGEAQSDCPQQRHIHAKLRRSAQQHTLGICHHGAEVGHGTHACENQGGIDAQLHAQIEDVKEASVVEDSAPVHVCGTGGIPQLRVIDAGTGQVGEQHTEGDTHQQQRLKLLYNAQIEQQAGNGNHDDLLDGVHAPHGGKGAKARLLSQIAENGSDKFHTSKPPQLRMTRGSPVLTAVPGLATTCATVPSLGASTSFSIFIASMIATISPPLTA